MHTHLFPFSFLLLAPHPLPPVEGFVTLVPFGTSFHKVQIKTNNSKMTFKYLFLFMAPAGM